MKTAIEIKTELDKTDLRITELETARARQTATVEATQKAFVDGTADAAKLNDEQGNLSVYERTIESLRSTFQTLKSAFEERSSDERRTELLKQMAAAANAVEPLINDYRKTRSELHQIVADYTKKLISKTEVYRSQQAKYQAIVTELKPTDAEIQESGLPPMTRMLAGSGHINHPSTGTFDEAVSLAENLLRCKIK